MNLRNITKYNDDTTQYGASFLEDKWIVNLWHPIAKRVKLIIFDKDDQNQIIKEIDGENISPNWTWTLHDDYNGYFYQYEITQHDNSINLCLDPYAKSMAAFNWSGSSEKVGKAAFVHVRDTIISSLPKVNKPQPIIYEAHVRDLTSLSKRTTQPGTFNALIETKVAEHLSDLGITHIQFLPIHNCFTLNESDKKILWKGEGDKWNTNYNWGYDPHNYFSINGWYSSDPENPYSRITEFKKVVDYFHENGIKVILDVVYNHMFTNKILDNVVPEYYFREDGNQAKPVGHPAVSSESHMMRRIIVESLEWFVRKFDVDGFRFDLMEFTDKKTIDILVGRLRKLKPNIIIHGEVWNWTDLDIQNTYIKGVSDNDLEIAYFNDTVRNAVKGEDDGDGFAIGLIGGNHNEFYNYLYSTFGNLMTFDAPIDKHSNEYNRFTDYPNNNLSYSACHDGHTLWDKINLTVKGSLDKKIEAYRQALIMTYAVPGRVLVQEGVELLYTKPNDDSGQDADRSHTSEHLIDVFNLGNVYNENSYKTTDYVNGLRWEALENDIVNERVYKFVKLLNNFRKNTPHFNVGTREEINKMWHYNNVDADKKIIDFTINNNLSKIRVIHNFGNTTYTVKGWNKLIIYSSFEKFNGNVMPNTSIILEVE